MKNGCDESIKRATTKISDEEERKKSAENEMGKDAKVILWPR